MRQLWWAIAGVFVVVIAGCNPLLGDPVTIGGELDRTSARYSGPPAAWIEVSVSGAASHTVYALALVADADLHGPASRSCIDAGGAVVPCAITAAGVQTPEQRVVPGDGTKFVRLMTVWPGETVVLVLVCVDPATQELGCPATLRTATRSVDESGALVGDLVAGAGD
jgi:hypothetical protein